MISSHQQRAPIKITHINRTDTPTNKHQDIPPDIEKRDQVPEITKTKTETTTTKTTTTTSTSNMIQRELCLLSLVESAEIKLRRQQERLIELERARRPNVVGCQIGASQPSETAMAIHGIVVVPEHEHEHEHGHEHEKDQLGLAQPPARSRKLAASIGWQLKSPAFVTLNEPVEQLRPALHDDDDDDDDDQQQLGGRLTTRKRQQQVGLVQEEAIETLDEVARLTREMTNRPSEQQQQQQQQLPMLAELQMNEGPAQPVAPILSNDNEFSLSRAATAAARRRASLRLELATATALERDKDKTDGLESKRRPSVAAVELPGHAGAALGTGEYTKLNHQRHYNHQGQQQQQQEQLALMLQKSDQQSLQNDRPSAVGGEEPVAAAAVAVAGQRPALPTSLSAQSSNDGRCGGTLGLNSTGAPHWQNSKHHPSWAHYDMNDCYVVGGQGHHQYKLGSQEHEEAAKEEEEEEEANLQTRRRSINLQQQRRQQQQVDDERAGGPTPTNDLIRTLLERDRLAFGLQTQLEPGLGLVGLHQRRHHQHRGPAVRRSSQVNNNEIESKSDKTREERTRQEESDDDESNYDKSERTSQGHSPPPPPPPTLPAQDETSTSANIHALTGLYYKALRTSASSPSNLSATTPTPNDFDADGDAGGRGHYGSSRESACKSGEFLSLKLAHENAGASLGRQFRCAGASTGNQQQQLACASGTWRRGGQNEASGSKWRKQEQHWQESQGQKEQQQQQQQQQVMARCRAGSNPLDRVRRVSGQMGTAINYNSAMQSAQQQQTGSVKSSSNNSNNNNSAKCQFRKQPLHQGKRHSIINLLSVGAASLTHTGHRTQARRSFAAFGMGANNAANCGDRGASGRHKTGRRLTSGGELLSAHLGQRQHEPSAQGSAQSLDGPIGAQQPQYDPLIPESGFKIVVMGTSGSGKTSIIQRFLYGTFSARHLPTVEDTYFIEFPYKKNLINISVSDTSGTYQFPAMRKLAINSGDAFILVYSVDDPQSFDCLEQLRQTILEEREQAYLESVVAACPSDSSSSSTSSLAPLARHQIVAAASGGGGGGSCGGAEGAQGPAKMMSSLTSTVMNHENHNHPHQNHHHHHNQLQPAPAAQDMSPARHWSLASLFSNHHHHHHNQQHQQQQPREHHHSSIGSSICSSSSCSSAENSRRSSISAAEAALRTRRTRKPPMVIVANKHDLPRDKHLINSDEIEALAVIDWNNGFVRASAALNWNIEEIFQQVLTQARQPPTLSEAIVSKRRKSLPPKLPHT